MRINATDKKRIAELEARNKVLEDVLRKVARGSGANGYVKRIALDAIAAADKEGDKTQCSQCGRSIKHLHLGEECSCKMQAIAAADPENVRYCSVCSTSFDVDEEGCEGLIGLFPFAFCATCRVGVWEWAQISFDLVPNPDDD